MSLFTARTEGYRLTIFGWEEIEVAYGWDWGEFPSSDGFEGFFAKMSRVLIDGGVLEDVIGVEADLDTRRGAILADISEVLENFMACGGYVPEEHIRGLEKGGEYFRFF